MTSVEIARHNGWTGVSINDVWHPPSGADIAVLSPGCGYLADSPSHRVRSQLFPVRADLLLEGFPYGLRTEVGQANHGFPVPFVKTGIISSFTSGDTRSQLIFCDGRNNPGFSGFALFVTVAADRSVTLIELDRATDPRMRESCSMADTGSSYQANTGLVIGNGLSEVIARLAKSSAGGKIS